LARSQGGTVYVAGLPALVNKAAETLALAGGDQPHNNMQPYLTLTFCIALQGVFPQRNGGATATGFSFMWAAIAALLRRLRWPWRPPPWKPPPPRWDPPR
jgi:hypothetical protein